MYIQVQLGGLSSGWDQGRCAKRNGVGAGRAGGGRDAASYSPQRRDARCSPQSKSTRARQQGTSTKDDRTKCHLQTSYYSSGMAITICALLVSSK